MFQPKKQIDIHEKCIGISKAIEYFQQKIQSKKESIAGFAVFNFPDIKRKWEHDMNIYERCIDRLFERYNKTLKQL